MISYDYYRIFYTAARCGNFTRAAEELMTSQSAVSHTISNLEHQLGCRLFLRTGRGIELTAEGKRLYEFAAAGCEQFSRGEAEITNAVNLEEGIIYLGATETAMRCYLIHTLGLFHRQHPGIKFRITNGSTGDAISALRSAAVDLAVVPTPLSLSHPLHQYPLLSFHDILIAGEQFRYLQEKTLHLAQLQQYPMICLDRGTTTRAFVEALYRKHDLILSPDMESATSDLIVPLVRENLGLGFVPEILAREALEKGEVFVLSLAETIENRQICLVTNDTHPLSLAAEAFRNFLLNHPT